MGRMASGLWLRIICLCYCIRRLFYRYCSVDTLRCVGGLHLSMRQSVLKALLEKRVSCVWAFFHGKDGFKESYSLSIQRREQEQAKGCSRSTSACWIYESYARNEACEHAHQIHKWPACGMIVTAVYAIISPPMVLPPGMPPVITASCADRW